MIATLSCVVLCYFVILSFRMSEYSVYSLYGVQDITNYTSLKVSVGEPLLAVLSDASNSFTWTITVQGQTPAFNITDLDDNTTLASGKCQVSQLCKILVKLKIHSVFIHMHTLNVCASVHCVCIRSPWNHLCCVMLFFLKYIPLYVS